MRITALTVVSIGAVFFAPHIAGAQLPLPELADAPDLRLASADAYLDRLRSVRQRITKNAQERGPEIDDAVARLRRQLDLSGERSVVRGFDPTAARRLLAALERESVLRDNAVEIVGRASQLAGQEPDALPASTNLDDLVEVALEIRRHQRRRRQRLALAQQLRTLSERADIFEDEGALTAETSLQQDRLRAAQADLAEAESLEAESLIRLGRRQLPMLREAWAPTSDRIASAADGLEAAEKAASKEQDRVRTIRARTATVARIRASEPDVVHQARQSQLDAYLAALGYQTMRAEAAVVRAQSRLTTLHAKAGLPVSGVAASRAQLVIRLAGIDQAVVRLETRLSELTGATPPRRARRFVQRERESLEQSILALRLARHDLTRALIYAELRQDPAAITERAPRSPELGYALSILVLLVAVFVLTRGYRWGAELLTYQRLLPDRLRIKKVQLGRLKTVAVLLWPVVVGAAAAALLIWPVWGLSLSIREALAVVDRPLFFVDETGVSLLSIVKLTFAVYAANVLSSALREFLRTRVYPQTEWDIGLTTALDSLVHYLMMSVGLVVGLRFVGVGFSTLAIIAGLLGIGIGFGLRNITENFISGLIILAERPIKIGDFIELGSSNLEGQVRRIRARSTTVVTRDNISIIIPNSEFVAGRVTNWSHGDPKVRIAVKVGVAYGSDTHLVRKVLLEVAARHGKVLDKPAPEVEFKAFGASSLDFTLRAWIDQQADRFRIASDLHFAVDAAFRKYRIVIAFPQLDLHFKTAEAHLLNAVTGRPPMGDADNATRLDGESTSGVG